MLEKRPVGWGGQPAVPAFDPPCTVPSFKTETWKAEAEGGRGLGDRHTQAPQTSLSVGASREHSSHFSPEGVGWRVRVKRRAVEQGSASPNGSAARHLARLPSVLTLLAGRSHLYLRAQAALEAAGVCTGRAGLAPASTPAPAQPR